MQKTAGQGEIRPKIWDPRLTLIQCDGLQPVCKRCEKAKAVCLVSEHTGGFVFLNENEYAIGKRKRPRGPNVKSTSIIPEKRPASKSIAPEIVLTSLDAVHSFEVSNNEANGLTIPSAPAISLETQTLGYYSQYYVSLPAGITKIVDSHLKHIFSCSFNSDPQSILGLAISSVSHATFGRARRNQLALEEGNRTYSRALIKINTALRSSSEAINDEVLLAVMLLSFYENSVLGDTAGIPNQRLENMAAKSFAHHDGAIALLKIRRQLLQQSESSMDLDRLVRRQLIRSLLLRSMPVPSWLRDGSSFGEEGLGLRFDRAMIITAKLRHQAAGLPNMEAAELKRRLTEAQSLDDTLIFWAKDLPSEDRYIVSKLQSGEHLESNSRILEDEIHIYRTVGHAGLWNRYRALRLLLNDITLRCLSTLPPLDDHLDDFTLEAFASLVDHKMQHTATDLCASIPYILGLVCPDLSSSISTSTIKTTNPQSLKATVKAGTASLLAWPLTIAMSVQYIPRKEREYLRARLLDVSAIIDDGVLERVAMGPDK